MRRLPAWVRSRPVLTCVVAAVVWLGYDTFGTLTAPGRLSPDVAAAAAAGRAQDVAVTLPFAPEQYHIKLFQSYGTVSGVRDTTVLVRRASPDAVHAIAKFYWVGHIDPIGQ